MTKRLFVLGYEGYGAPFADRFNLFSIPRKIFPDSVGSSDLPHSPDMILFTGGEDISNRLYRSEEEVGQGQSLDPLYQRDIWEKSWYEFAIKHSIPMFGTCRGMQIITALTGGKLIEHVDNHSGSVHPVTTNDGKRFRVNSIHHQMCLPLQGTFELLAYAYGIVPKKQHPSEFARDLRVGPGGDWVEPEALYFPKVKAMGVQWHPEGLVGTESHAWLREKVQECLNI